MSIPLLGFESEHWAIWALSIISALTLLCVILVVAMVRLRRAIKQERELLAPREANLEQLERTVAILQGERDTMFRHLSQELRTPMHGIVGALPMLSDQTLTDTQRDCLSIIDISSRSILTFLNDISDYSKLEKGNFKLSRHPMDPVALVESVAQLFNSDSFQSGLELICEVPSDPVPFIRGDSSRIQQVLLTVIGRSFQNTRDGSVLLRLEVVESGTQQGDPSLIFIVEDEGSILEPSFVERIFDPFPAKKGERSATGPAALPGMALTRKLIEAMGGEIQVEMPEARFLRTTIILPFASESSEASWQVPPSYLRFPGKRALVIQSSLRSRQMLCKHLKAWDIGIETASSFQEALRLLESRLSTDVVFMEPAGLRESTPLKDMVAALRQDEQNRELPVILLSHLGGRSQMKAIGNLKQVQQIPLPLRIEVLHAALKRAVRETPATHKSFARLKPDTSHESEGGTTAFPLENNEGFQFIPYLLPLHTELRIEPSLRILLAEDNLINQKVTALMLRKIGFEIDIVTDGAQAVEIVRKHAYDVVLMDKLMPVMDGIEATRRIRAVPHIKQPVIIALVASASMEDEIECRKATMDNFLTKPVPLEKMKAALAYATSVLEQRKPATLPSEAVES